MPLSYSSPRNPAVSIASLEQAAAAAQQRHLEAQRSMHSPTCPICRLSPPDLADLEHNMSSDTVELSALTAKYNVTVKDVLLHAQRCLGNLRPYERDDLTAQFARQIVNGLQHSIMRAQGILDELYEAKDDDGAYMHRDAKLAMAYNQLAKTQAATLDGVIAAADRKRITEYILQQQGSQQREERTMLDLSNLSAEQLEALDAALANAEDNT